MSTEQPQQSRPRFALPHVFAILIALTLIASLVSYVIPAGEYEREVNEAGQEIVVPESYEVVESNPVNPVSAFTAIPEGLVDAALIIFAVFIIGGAFGVIDRTRIVSVLVDLVARKLSGKDAVMITVVMVAFSTICAFIGLLELSLFIIPILIPICLALELDSVTATAIALVSGAAGFAAALTNPFTVAIAQELGGVELYSGIGFRLIALVIMTTSGILFVLNYARKVKRNPEISITYERDRQRRQELMGSEVPEFDTRLKLTALIVGLGFLSLVFGILIFSWYLVEISTVFILIALFAGLASGMGVSQICDNFVSGLQTFALAAFAVGLARAIVVVFEEARILDTIVYGLSLVVQNLPAELTAVGMLFTQGVLNFIIPSGSGQTLVSMPIMFPLADITGVTRQTAILALQLGDGLSNIFYPTLGFLLACLGIAGIRYEQWFTFILPLMGIWYGLAAVIITVAHVIGWN